MNTMAETGVTNTATIRETNSETIEISTLTSSPWQGKVIIL